MQTIHVCTSFEHYSFFQTSILWRQKFEKLKSVYVRKRRFLQTPSIPLHSHLYIYTKLPTSIMKFLYMSIPLLSGVLALPALFNHHDASCSLGIADCLVYCQMDGYMAGTCNEETNTCQCSLPFVRNGLDPYYNKKGPGEPQDAAPKEPTFHSISMSAGDAGYDKDSYDPVPVDLDEKPATSANQHASGTADKKQ